MTSSSPIAPFFLHNLFRNLNQQPGKGEENYSYSDIDQVHAHLFLKNTRKENKDIAKNGFYNINILLRCDFERNNLRLFLIFL